MSRLIALSIFLLLAGPLRAVPVEFESVDATFSSASGEELKEVIDGGQAGRHGWSVAPHTEQIQAAIFVPSDPVDAEVMEVTLCFLSGRPNSFFGEFTLTATTDSGASLEARWERLAPVRFSATGPELTLRDDGHFVAEGNAADAVFHLTVRATETPITAFRVEVFPSRQIAGRDFPQVASGAEGDFVLTEFRVDRAAIHTTNIAWGQPVHASHPVRFPAETLTDGMPGTFSHPTESGLGASFYFEIDLGSVRKLDHLTLRNRGDGSVPERLSRLTLDLYDEPPDAGLAPVWRARVRGDGSHPEVGEVDVVRSDEGMGTFSGRWLRISSDSPVPLAPQLAEVEVYEDLGLQLASLRADGEVLPMRDRFEIAPGVRWLAVAMKSAHSGMPEDTPCRWRFRGYHADWQPAVGFLAEGACPPPGTYVFEAQIRHTDREWNAAMLSVHVSVRGYFWQSANFWILIGALAVIILAWIVRFVTRRRLALRMAGLEAKAALNEERARISRDMHDEVGAQLAQLAILQSMMAREHRLPAEAQASMQQLAQTTRKVVASLDEVVWAVNPRNDQLPSLAAYLEQCATGYLEPLDIACRLDAPLEWPEIEVRAQVRHNLVLAMREALQNVIKHAGATEVKLTLRLDEGWFTLTLADNGKGLPEDCSGLEKDGLGNMASRLAAIGGRCDVRLGEGGGTVVEMRVHLPGDAATVKDR